jgi:pimeloyl-ACP methyl ester carboxylesterase
MTTEKILEFQKRKISYKVLGEGPVVILIHGMPFNGNLWMPLLTGPKQEDKTQAPPSEESSLPGKFKFIIPDLPGSGASEMIADMSMEGMAEVIKNIIDTESSKVSPVRRDLAGAILIGHSMGGYISLAFAEKYPEYLSGLGLFHSTAYADSEERKTNRKKAIESVKSNGTHDFLKTMIPNLFSPTSRDKIAHLIEQFIEQTNNFSQETLVSYHEAMMQRPDRTSVLKNLKIPMLLIAGKYDNAAPLNDLLKQCHLPEISYFHILSESGHMGMIEELGKSNDILNDYLINLS